MGYLSVCCWSCIRYQSSAEDIDFLSPDSTGFCSVTKEERNALDLTNDCKNANCDVRRVDRIKRAIGVIPVEYRPRLSPDRKRTFPQQESPVASKSATRILMTKGDMTKIVDQAVEWADPVTFIVPTALWGRIEPSAIQVLLNRKVVVPLKDGKYKLSPKRQKQKEALIVKDAPDPLLDPRYLSRILVGIPGSARKTYLGALKKVSNPCTTLFNITGLNLHQLSRLVENKVICDPSSGRYFRSPYRRVAKLFYEEILTEEHIREAFALCDKKTK
jgi:hypothetical protein